VEEKQYKVFTFYIAFFLWVLLLTLESHAQETTKLKKSSAVKTIWDIPHKTFREKWMWIHRSVAFNIIKEKPLKHDTLYINVYDKRLVVTIPVANRFLKFTLVDLESGNKLNFAPNSEYNLGISISSRWASFIVSTRIKVFGGDEGTRGKTNFRDYQLNLYGRKLTTDMFVQYYNGFYIRNSKDYTSYVSEKPFEIRKDVYAIHMGVSSYYILNNKRFSYRNSFAFTERQKKSAGSLLLGVYYSYFTATGDPSLVSSSFRSSFDTLSLIRSGQTHNFGINLGYIYTFVFLKKCYATASFVQGVGGQHISFLRDDKSHFNQLIGGAGKLHLRFGLGYDHGRYFVGIMGMTDYILPIKKSTARFDYSYGKFMIYTGYRFSVIKAERKLLRRMKLIEY
jgi:hypothetical protein